MGTAASGTKKPYRNAIRSEKAIIHAYVELIKNKNTKKITVTEIVNKADLNRSTFYAHFSSVDDVRERIQSDMLSDVLSCFDSSHYINSLSEPSLTVKHFIDLIKRDEEMYKTLLNVPENGDFIKSIREIVVERYLSDEVILPHIKDKEGFEIYIRLFIGGYISILKDWAAGDISMSLDRCTEIISEAIRICVESYLEK